MRHTKAIISKGLGLIPWGARMEGLLVTKGLLPDFEKSIDSSVKADWMTLMRRLDESGVTVRGRDLLDAGAGRRLVLPLCFVLAGARSCHTVDLFQRLTFAEVSRTLAGLEPFLPLIAEVSGRDLVDVRTAWMRMSGAVTLPALLGTARIFHHAPADLRSIALPDESVDLVYSSGALEHLPARMIPGLMRESRRLLREGGMVIHSVDCGDHLDREDPLGYLQYTDLEWTLRTGRRLHQNRLRPGDFVRAAQQAGLEVVSRRICVEPDARARLEQTPLAGEFYRYSHDDLAATSLEMIARPDKANFIQEDLKFPCAKKADRLYSLDRSVFATQGQS